MTSIDKTTDRLISEQLDRLLAASYRLNQPRTKLNLPAAPVPRRDFVRLMAAAMSLHRHSVDHEGPAAAHKPNHAPCVQCCFLPHQPDELLQPELPRQPLTDAAAEQTIHPPRPSWPSQSIR